jgi:hypothetical protein
MNVVGFIFGGLLADEVMQYKEITYSWIDLSKSPLLALRSGIVSIKGA